MNGAPKYWFLNTVLLCEKPGLLGEMIDLKAGEGSIQDKPGTSHGARKKKVPPKKNGACQKDRTQPEEAPNGQS